MKAEDLREQLNELKKKHRLLEKERDAICVHIGALCNQRDALEDMMSRLNNAMLAIQDILPDVDMLDWD